MIVKMMLPDNEPAALRLLADLLEEKGLVVGFETEKPLSGSPPADAHALEAGGVRLDPSAHEVYVGGEPVGLNAKEFDLLHFLMRNEGRLVPHLEILQAVWGYDEGNYLVKNTVMRLRQKLGQAATTVRSVRKRGYLFKSETTSEPG